MPAPPSFPTMVFPPRSELHGTVLDERYRVQGTIGEGGSGAVLAAERLEDGKVVALKVLKRTAAVHADFVQRLRAEATVARTLRHPGIVRCIDEGTLADGSPYWVMERLSGESLSALLWRTGPLPVQTVCVIGARVASVLHSVHAHGYVHRDVKTEHVWLSPAAEGGMAVHLLDFGVCLPPDSQLSPLSSERAELFGTPGYMSPEQARGDHTIDGRSDLFALGVVLFEALTGELPFQGANAAVLMRRVLEERAPYVTTLRKDVPQELAQCLARLLDPEPSARMPNARSTERALLKHAPLAQQHARAISARLHLTAGAPGQTTRSAQAAPTHNLALAAT
jgi:eukaryotic-like serine/threonine-protein kinase